MADILEKTLGDYLYLPDGPGPLPAPLDLVGKVAIKGKRPPENNDGELTESLSTDDTVEGMTEEEVREFLKSNQGKRDKVRGLITRKGSKGKHLPECNNTELNESPSTEDTGGDVTKDDVNNLLKSGDRSNSKASKAPLPKTHPDLAKLTTLNGVKFKAFESSLQLPLADMHSFAESKLSKIYKDPSNVRMWKEYNVLHLSRIYPAGTRVDSSNYNPVVPWSSGCQLVALNFQTEDSSMRINHGRFRENGSCGYVRKPPSVYSKDEEPNTGKSMKLKIKILSGSCLPKPDGEPVGEGEQSSAQFTIV